MTKCKRSQVKLSLCIPSSKHTDAFKFFLGYPPQVNLELLHVVNSAGLFQSHQEIIYKKKKKKKKFT